VKQLGNRLAKEEDSRAKGLVAINISKIVNPGNGFALLGLRRQRDRWS
jgi:hypothetical protein